MAVDVTGVFLCLKHELAHIAKVGRGAIMNTASVTGIRADPGMSPYVLAKHAVAGSSKAAAIDYATHSIRVNAIAPGLVRTPMTERWLNAPIMRDKVLADALVGRAADPEESVPRLRPLPEQFIQLMALEPRTDKRERSI